ncbi:uncharacterized protein LOC129268537 [Lytechinus pictus]|uniref:uncharacterized protein LOC129268537 n=1 Tax=Lytechinus pictus TaxID=7653 RepID=UPI0030B9CD68
MYNELQILRIRLMKNFSMARIPIIIACILIVFQQVYLPVVQAVSTVEGDEAYLAFPYPCNSSQVTLQQSTKVPFYRSTDGLSPYLPSDQVQRFNVQNRIENGTCSLALTITYLRRDDQGSYILFVYKDGYPQNDDTQNIRLQVDYPPGKASCVVGHSKGGEWVGVDCTANAGTIPGKIECYQNGLWMFPLNDPTVVDSLLKQTFLILESQPAFCCSSPWHEYRERCECNDTALFLDDTSEKPCLTISTTTREVTNNVQSFESTSEPSSITTTSITDTQKDDIIISLSVIIIIMMLINLFFIYKFRKKYNDHRNTGRSNQPTGNENCVKVKDIPEEIALPRHVNCGALSDNGESVQ